MTFIYVNSDDAGAPTLTGEPGSMITLLKAALINGVGAKPAAGWTIAFEDVANHICVFRPDAGHRFFYKVVDDGSSSKGARVATLEAFKSMFDINTGVGDFCGATYKAYLCKSRDLNANAAAWALFADDKKCWWFAGSNYHLAASASALNDNFESAYTFFGDYNSVGADSNSAAIFSVIDTRNPTPVNKGFFLTSNTDVHNCPGNINGVLGSTKLAGFCSSAFGGDSSAGNVWGHNLIGMLSNHPLTSDIHVAKLMISDTNGSGVFQGLTENVRGSLPGLVLPLKSNPPLFEDYTINGKNYVNIGLNGKWPYAPPRRPAFLMSTDGLDF